VTLRMGELEVLHTSHPGALLVEQVDGTALVHLPKVDLPQGWSSTSTDVWFMVPVGYPGAMPDCFWAAGNLRLANGELPANSAIQVIGGRGSDLGLWFSWHLQEWRPAADQLVTYAHFIESRLHRAA
jgi:hypothetical protein